jgi:hypothetical protein
MKMAENFTDLFVGGGLTTIGVLIGAFVNNLLYRKTAAEERNYLERKELYLRVTKVLAGAGVGKDNTTEDWTVVQLWVKIVAPVEVQNCLKEIVDTNNGHPGRPAAVDKLYATMRKDLRRGKFKNL